MASFVEVTDVLDYLRVEGGDGTQYSPALIGSNIRTASGYLQRRTGRQFEAQENVTKTFSTDGAAAITLPDLRSITEVTHNGSLLVADETYHLQADSMQSGVFTGIQFQSYGSGGSYRSYADWFDRDYDRLWAKGWRGTGPNNLVIRGDWGHDPLPDELMHATKVLAAWYTKRPDAVLASTVQTIEGGIIELGFPLEVEAFIQAWTVGPMVTAV